MKAIKIIKIILRHFPGIAAALLNVVWQLAKVAWRPSFWRCIHQFYKAGGKLS